MTAQPAHTPASQSPPIHGGGSSLVPSIPSPSIPQSLSSLAPAHLVARALRKWHWLQQWREACDLNPDRQGGASARLAASRLDRALRIVTDAKRVEGPSFKISVRSLQLWHRAASTLGPDGQPLGARALVDHYRTSEPRDSSPAPFLPRSLVPLLPQSLPPSACPLRKASRVPSSRSPAASEHFLTLYRTENRFTVEQCHTATLDESARRGWSWPASVSATARWLRETDDIAFTFLCRHGRRAWNHKYLPHLRRDWGVIEPGHCYIGDHCQADFWISLGPGKRPVRPWLTAVQDGRSRCIVGWHLGPAPHQDAILRALRNAFVDWAIPQVLYVDNGKDFTSKLITGLTKSELRALRREFGVEWRDVLRRERSRALCDDQRWFGVTGELGIDVRYALPYSPWSKPIERWFREFHRHCCRRFTTYCGPSTEQRPEDLRHVLESGDLPTLDEARARVGETVDLFHARPHRGKGCDGQPPLAVWQAATRLRRAVEDQLLFLMDIRGVYKVGANGVTITIDGGSISYGARSPALRRHVGRQVLIAADPDHRAVVWALTPDRDRRQLIARLDANEYVHPLATGEEHREAIATEKRRQAAAAKAGLRAPRKQVVAAMNAHVARRHAALRATGTDGRQGVRDQGIKGSGPYSLNPSIPQSLPDVVPVRTGFESVSMPSRNTPPPLIEEPVSYGGLAPAESHESPTFDFNSAFRDLYGDAETMGAPPDDLRSSPLEGLL